MTHAALKNTFCLRHKVSIYIPGTCGPDTPADNSAFVDAAAALLSDCFGGATSTPAVGYWSSPAAGLIREKNNIVFAYAAENDLERGLDRVVDFARKMREQLRQEAVAIELDGQMFFL